MKDTEPKQSLLIIDDEENMLHMLSSLLGREGYEVLTAPSGEKGIELIQDHSFLYILCDIRMPTMNGIEFLEAAKELLDQTTVIMMSAYGNIELALEALNAGAYDFVSKPFKKDEVLLTLKKAEERERLRRENKSLRLQIEQSQNKDAFSHIVYQNQRMETIINLGRKTSQYPTTTLIVGESGTGKELLAKGIHGHSPRKNKQFFAINCGSIPSQLIESELFGYVKGAFTGADKNTKGIFEDANGSTLFLDEIGELPLSMQVRLLRVLQENEIKPVGATTSKKVDVKILAATAKNLGQAVSDGSFRQDLFYRLNIITIELPPLRDRRDDIPLLCHHFIKKFNKSFNLNIEKISPQAMETLMDHHWPGNIRELENFIQRAAVLSDGNTISLDHLMIENDDHDKSSGHLFRNVCSLKEAQKILEKHFIEKTLQQTDGNKSAAAKILELSYPALLSKIKNLSVET